MKKSTDRQKKRCNCKVSLQLQPCSMSVVNGFNGRLHTECSINEALFGLYSVGDIDERFKLRTFGCAAVKILHTKIFNSVQWFFIIY